MKEVLFAGIDVDDRAFNVCIVDNKSRIVSMLKSDPHAKSLAKVLRKNCANARLTVCYEATYLGYSLQRELERHGIDCKIIAPTSIPKSPSQKVKTDRVDAIHLAKCFQKGLLATITPPTIDEEADRDLIRERQSIMAMASSTKRILLNKCRRLGWNYLREENKRDYWTQHHRRWLDKKIKNAPQSAKFSLRTMLFHLNSLLETVALYDNEIQHLAKQEKYKAKVEALRCFKGVEVHTAMGLVTEICDIAKFSHPKQLVSYCGLDIIEYSSGGNEYRYKITKMGNSHLRRLLVEACQFSLRSPTPSRALKLRRSSATAESVEISERCLKRLYSKGHRLLHRGKPRNKVKVACARR